MNVSVNILNENVKIPDEIIEAAGGDGLIARIFFNRGYKSAEIIRQMLDDRLYKPTVPDEFPQMDRATEIIAKAIDSEKLIAVYGDYDVDGVTSTALLLQCLNHYTAHIIYHVPDRFTEGYGMNGEVIRDLSGKGVSLVITCDCGISNINEIKLAKELGMEVVVTDHHNIPDELPPADAVLNPKLLSEDHRARNISGCAMAYFLAASIFRHYENAGAEDEFSDLLAMSLIADVVSLNGENRYLLKKALPKLFETKRTGLKELYGIIERNGKLESEEDVAFQIAPRINAAGRMESARVPVELMLCKNREKAAELALKIDNLNTERKRVQQEIINQADSQVEGPKKAKTALVLYNEYWHHGIIGIAAGKICEKYGKPAILLTLKEDGSTIVGSARSIEGIDIYGLIKECGDMLLKFGGHSQAAGLSMNKEMLGSFTTKIESLAEQRYYIKENLQVNVDCMLELDEVDESLMERINRAGPFGEGFAAPIFFSKKVSVLSDRKSVRNHHFMVLASEKDIRIAAVKWFGDENTLTGRAVDITYKVEKSKSLNGYALQLGIDQILDMKEHAKEAFEGDFIDLRGVGIDDLHEVLANSVVYYEGLQSVCPIHDTINRHTIKSYNWNNTCRKLVFLSTPVNTEVFREVTALVNPYEVLISFAFLPDYSFNGFVSNMIGMIKYAINNNRGKASIEELSVKLCAEEFLVEAALRYLETAGLISYTVDDDEDTICLIKGNGEKKQKAVVMEKNLRDALKEKNAYQEFLKKLEIGRFKEYLK